MIFHGVIPAAGEGLRAYPATKYIPKVLLEVAGKPLIVRNIELMRDQLGVREITVILGHFGDQIRTALGSGERLGARSSRQGRQQIFQHRARRSREVTAEDHRRIHLANAVQLLGQQCGVDLVQPR